MYNAIRFINQAEKDLLDKKGEVVFINQQKPWNDHGTLYFFVIDKYKKEDYEPIIKALAKYNNIKYDYIVYLNFTGYNYKYLAAYDKEQVDRQLKEGQIIPFEVDETAYDTGPIYVVPEYRRTQYNKRQVVKVEEIKLLLEKNTEEAINNMPENKELDNVLNNTAVDETLGDNNLTLGVDIEENMMTFMQMYLELVESGVTNEAAFRRVLNDIDFKEEIGHTYMGADLDVGVANIPIITDGIAEVKMVKLEQGDHIGLIVPLEVASTYQTLVEDPTVIDVVNNVEEVAFETYGFNTDDETLLELVKTLYINTGNKGPAFTLVGETKVLVKEEKAEEDDFMTSDLTQRSNSANTPMFDTIDEPVEEIEDIGVNLESYNKFRRETKALTNLEKALWEQAPKVIKENIKTKYISNKNILAIQVNNRSIYETFNNLPGHAKKLLTTIGESIRTNPDTQLVDSINNRGKRIFLVAENNNNNFWVVKDEKLSLLEQANKNNLTTIPDKREVIVLERTNVRLDSRTKVPYTHGKQIAFVERNKTIK